ncbi:hypothetical protein BpHYR1_014110, partial [Brachionus plicatilis]
MRSVNLQDTEVKEISLISDKIRSCSEACIFFLSMTYLIICKFPRERSGLGFGDAVDWEAILEPNSCSQIKTSGGQWTTLKTPDRSFVIARSRIFFMNEVPKICWVRKLLSMVLKNSRLEGQALFKQTTSCLSHLISGKFKSPEK